MMTPTVSTTLFATLLSVAVPLVIAIMARVWISLCRWIGRCYYQSCRGDVGNSVLRKQLKL